MLAHPPPVCTSRYSALGLYLDDVWLRGAVLFARFRGFAAPERIPVSIAAGPWG